ncbi:MAG: hypothetical protein WCL00_02115, partial [Bacteroidota bacterium]
DNGLESEVSWEVRIDFPYKSYIYCLESHSRVWYHFDHDILYLTHFEGDRNSLLYYYYLAAYKVTTGFYRNLEISDLYPLTVMNLKGLLFFQDFLAPFKIWMRPEYSMKYIKSDEDFTDSRVCLESSASMKIGKREIRRIDFELEATKSGLERMVIKEGKRKMEARRIEDGK